MFFTYLVIVLLSIIIFGYIILIFTKIPDLNVVFIKVTTKPSTYPNVEVKMDAPYGRSVFTYTIKNISELSHIISDLISSKLHYDLGDNDLEALYSSVADGRDFYLNFEHIRKPNVKLTAIYQKGKTICLNEKSQMRSSFN